MKTSLPAVNVQYPWADLIISGKKTIETRFYPLPKSYVGKKMLLIQTPGPSKKNLKRRIVAVIVFGESFQYLSREHFYNDTQYHFVAPSTPRFNWESGRGKHKWGWPVLRVQPISCEYPEKLPTGRVFTRHFPVPKGVTNLNI